MKSKKKTRGVKVGLILSLIQGIITAAFIVGLFVLGLLPLKFIIPIIIVLVILWVIPFLNQMFCRKRVIFGRILSVLMSVVLLAGMAYVFKTQGMLNSITGGDKKIDNIVVAVLDSDRAQKIEDAEDYRFGIQLKVKSNETNDVIKELNEKLNTNIDTAKYNNIDDQVKALYDGDVEAIIFNNAYVSVIEENYPKFKEETRIIYSHDIVSALDNAIDVSIDITEPFTVYLSGIDVAGSIESTGRSDVNILAVVNPSTHQLLLVTTPRDYYVVLPGISNGMPDKLTHAGLYGVDASMETLSYLYDVDVDYYARVNFTSLPQMVNALGGVTVYSDYEFDISEDAGPPNHIHVGENFLVGADALGFARERQNLPDGDFGRGRNQQILIKAMMKKAVSPAILSGAFEIIDSVSENVDTNIPIKFIKDIIRWQISKPAAWNVSTMSADGTPTYGLCFSSGSTELSVCEPDYDSVSAITYAIDKVYEGIPLDDVEVISDGTESEAETETKAE